MLNTRRSLVEDGLMEFDGPAVATHPAGFVSALPVVGVTMRAIALAFAVTPAPSYEALVSRLL